MKLIKLVKLKELPNALYPNNIVEGFEIIGNQKYVPEIGFSFIVETETQYFITSEVTEILNENTFKTLNSIYQYVEI